jgi:uncharacterized membrane protein YesL
MFRRALPIIGRSLADLWDNILTLTVVNALWALSALPGLLLFFLNGGLIMSLLAIVVLVLTLGPTTAALFYVTAEVSREEKLELRDFFTGVRRYYKRGWVAAGINAAFIVLDYFNLVFYSSSAMAGSPLALLFILWVYLTLLWFMMQIYLWPLVLRMETLKVFLLLRNSVLATFKYPAFTFILTLFLLALLIGSFYTAFVLHVLAAMALQAIISNKALLEVLERERGRSETAALPIDVPPPLEKIQRVEDLPESALEHEPVPTRNAPDGVKRRSPSITRSVTGQPRKEK